MEALLETTEQAVDEIATARATHQQRIEETAMWEEKVAEAKRQETEVETAAGEQVLAGADLAAAGAMIAAAKSVVAAAERGLAAARRAQEEAAIEVAFCEARKLQQEGDALQAQEDQQYQEINDHIDTLAPRDGVCWVQRPKRYQNSEVAALHYQSSMTFHAANQRMARLDKDFPRT
jgi:hypothetical protein